MEPEWILLHHGTPYPLSTRTLAAWARKRIAVTRRR